MEENLILSVLTLFSLIQKKSLNERKKVHFSENQVRVNFDIYYLFISNPLQYEVIIILFDNQVFFIAVKIHCCHFNLKRFKIFF